MNRDEIIKKEVEYALELFNNQIETDGREVIKSFVAAHDLIDFHHTFGRYLRNEYTLWDNKIVGKTHPDDYSFKLMQDIQTKLKKVLPNE